MLVLRFGSTANALLGINLSREHVGPTLIVVAAEAFYAQLVGGLIRW